MALIDGNYALITRPSRRIGTLMPNVVVEESTTDELTITEHPVEIGAPIADHSFKRPVEIEMRCGWSDSTGQSTGYAQSVYEQLLSLQARREPFDVYTPKRKYTNMLIAGISVMTDMKSEYALNVSCRLRQVIITKTKMTSGGTPTTGSPATTKGWTGTPGSVSAGGVGTFEQRYNTWASQSSGIGNIGGPSYGSFAPTPQGWAARG